MNKYKNEEDQLPPRWLIEDQLAQQKEDAKYLIKYNKRQVEKQKFILSSLEKFLTAPKFSVYNKKHGWTNLEGVLNAIDETKDQIREFRKEICLYMKEGA